MIHDYPVYWPFEGFSALLLHINIPFINSFRFQDFNLTVQILILC